MIITCGENGTLLDENTHWDHGLLIDYDYSFLYPKVEKKLKEIALRMAKDGRNDLLALLVREKDTWCEDNINEVLLHRTVSIYI